MMHLCVWELGHYWFRRWPVTRALFQYPIERLIFRFREVSKPQDLYLEYSDRSAIWQAPWQYCCRGACQMSKRYDDLNYKSRDFGSSRVLTIRRIIGYWSGALFYPKPFPYIQCQLVMNWTSEIKFNLNLNQTTSIVFPRKCIWKCLLQNGSHFVQAYICCLNGSYTTLVDKKLVLKWTEFPLVGFKLDELISKQHPTYPC